MFDDSSMFHHDESDENFEVWNVYHFERRCLQISHS